MSRSKMRPSTSASRQANSAWMVSGLSQMPPIIFSRPASMRLAMAISPSRDSSSTEHLGRPKGKRVDSLSLAPVAKRLSRFLRLDVQLAPDCVGEAVESMSQALQPGQVMLLENLRFHAGEESNDDEFADGIARLGDVYVNDAFGAAHRAHASVVGVPERVKPAAAGFLMQRELEQLGSLLHEPARPYVAVLGGAKVSGKVDVLENLIPRVDCILIGGGMMFTFVRSRDGEIGKSLLEEDRIELAGKMWKSAEEHGTELIVAPDCRATTSLDDTQFEVVPSNEVPADRLGADIGPASEALFAEKLRGAKTIFWNGPMGVFEKAAYAGGTLHVAQAIAAESARGARTVVGGGDSVSALTQADLTEKVSHVSTGGGASLELLEGKTLPGLAALDEPQGANQT